MLSVCQCVCVSTLTNMNISETSGLIATRYYMNHHWDGGTAALGLRPDQIGTLVSMATDSCLKKSCTFLRSIQNIFWTCWLSGERLLPFGLLVYSLLI